LLDVELSCITELWRMVSYIFCTSRHICFITGKFDVHVTLYIQFIMQNCSRGHKK